MTELPRGWRRVSLVDLGTWYGGGTPSKARSDYWSDGTVPWLSPKDMGPEVIRSTQDRITEAAVGGSAVRRVPAGSVALVVRSGILERTLPIAVVPMEVTLNQDMKALVPGPDVDARWVAWGLRSREQAILRQCRKAGTTVASIETKRLLAQELPVPPLDEQRRIVDILEDHLSRLDVTSLTLAESEPRLSVLRISLIAGERRRLLDRGIQSRRIGDICETSLGKMLDAKRALGTPTPYLRNINVRWGEVDQADVLSVPLTEEERSRFALEPGDLMVCEGGEPGRCAIWKGSGQLMTYQKALHRLRPRDGRTRPAFLAAMLEELIRSGRADRWFTGTTIKHLPQEKLRLLEVPVPPGGEQDEFLARLDALTGDIDRFAIAHAVAMKRASALRQSLLKSAFSGQLTGRCTTEPAGQPLEVLGV